MTSKDIYTPYFYIIQHKETGILYAGSKWAKGCHPDEFMQPNGYTTSSPTINAIIDQEGLDSFEILRIDTNCDGLHPYDYETLFLQCLDCASSPDWYNEHNNSGIAFGTIHYKKCMLKKYDNETYTNRKKAKITNKEKYGYDSPLESPIIREKAKITNKEKYGYESTNSVPEIKQKMLNTFQEKYGVSNPFQIPEVIEKNQQKMKNTLLIKIGYDNISKRPFLSVIATKKVYAKPSLSRWHPEFKQFY